MQKMDQGETFWVASDHLREEIFWSIKERETVKLKKFSLNSCDWERTGRRCTTGKY